MKEINIVLSESSSLLSCDYVVNSSANVSEIRFTFAEHCEDAHEQKKRRIKQETEPELTDDDEQITTMDFTKILEKGSFIAFQYMDSVEENVMNVAFGEVCAVEGSSHSWKLTSVMIPDDPNAPLTTLYKRKRAGLKDLPPVMMETILAVGVRFVASECCV
jgi:hypothetical protein